MSRLDPMSHPLPQKSRKVPTLGVEQQSLLQSPCRSAARSLIPHMLTSELIRARRKRLDLLLTSMTLEIYMTVQKDTVQAKVNMGITGLRMAKLRTAR